MSTAITISDLANAVQIPEKGTLSLTLAQDEFTKLVLFGFAQGQELSEHTAAVPAMIQQISGEAQWTLGEEKIDAKPGTLSYMPANLPHSISASTPCVMLLTLLKTELL
ncbi:MAG TPA: cupin [Phycisphaerales bacterium]|nr:cupin [Phycisphaerales bacterium]|tara:strand:+ start:3451 stop:3777 length:327 start_codon:yes stop_codon:yes gene_type:complete